jgi:hypothetical protein
VIDRQIQQSKHFDRLNQQPTQNWRDVCCRLLDQESRSERPGRVGVSTF